MKKDKPRNGHYKMHHGLNKRLTLLALFIAAGILYAIIDYLGPKEISIRQDVAFGMPCLRARELIVQEYDKGGNLWATRGMIVYLQKKGSEKFVRVAHVPTGPSLFWLRNFTIVRRITIRPECVEMVVTGKGDITALSAGRMWHLGSGKKNFEETLRLAHYGFGDQGIRNDGIVCIDDSTLYLGEYFQNPEKAKVRIFKSVNSGRSWRVAFEFQPGQIRHIHAVQQDTFSQVLWVCTGDRDEESSVIYSGDGFRSLDTLGQGSQQWRICQLVFTEDAVYWGTDTGEKEIAGIYRWNRKNKEIVKLSEIDGAMFFGTRLANGLIVMSTNREGGRSEKDDHTRIWIIMPENQTIPITGGTWRFKKPDFWSKFAQLRLQRNQGSTELAITCLNQREFPDGELIIISENTLLETVKSKLKVK
jgi:hypothetical protein